MAPPTSTARAGPLLVLFVLFTGCVSPTSSSGWGPGPRFTAREAVGPAPSRASGVGAAAEPDAPARPSRHPGSPEVVKAAPARAEAADARNALAAQLAVRGALLEVSVSTRRIAEALSRLRTSPQGLAGRASGLFVPQVEYGAHQLRWMEAELATATRLAHAAAEARSPPMQLALLRLAGPRLEASLLGSLVLSAWIDFLTLVDGLLEEGATSQEALYVNLERWRRMMTPTMTALASREPGQVDAAIRDAPALMGQFSDEFKSTVETLRVARQRGERVILAAQVIEMATLLSAMRFSLPSPPPSAPALLGVGLVVGGDGVMMGTRLVVSAE